MARKYIHHVIGIDPDVDRNGICYLNARTREVYVEALSFPVLLDKIREISQMAFRNGEPFVVVVEAGWLNAGNWHVHSRDRSQKSAAIGAKVGRNAETGHKIIEMLQHWGIVVEEMRPLRKMWKGKDGKITSEEILQFVEIKGRTNQEMRDATLLAWCYADLPIVMKKLSKKG